MLPARIALLAFALTVSFGASQVAPQSHYEAGKLFNAEAQKNVRTIEIRTGRYPDHQPKALIIEMGISSGGRANDR